MMNYEYKGYLKPFLPAIIAGLQRRDHPKIIAKTILAKMRPEQYPPWPNFNPTEEHVAQMVTYIADRYGFPAINPIPDQQRFAARREHAWLMRAEGLTFRQIAEHIGDTSASNVRLYILKFASEMERAMRHTKWTIT